MLRSVVVGTVEIVAGSAIQDSFGWRETAQWPEICEPIPYEPCRRPRDTPTGSACRSHVQNVGKQVDSAVRNALVCQSGGTL